MNPSATDFRDPLRPGQNDRRQSEAHERSLKIAFELHNAGRKEEAEAICRVLLENEPQDAQLLFLLGMILHKTGRDDEALRWLSLAAQYQPASARIWNGLGCVRQSLADPAEAVRAFERGLALEPQSATGCHNLGRSYYALDDVVQAEALFRRAVDINPRDAASWNNLGKCLKELNRLEESVAAYEHALAMAPDYELARYGRAISLLAAGRLVEGFREYESRWCRAKRRKFPQPAWQGEYAPDKTLFLHAEQGFGDAMQMVRFIPAARERVARVVLECRPELTTLFQYSQCADTVIPYGAPIPPFDIFLPLASLPRVLGVSLENLPAPTPYLLAPPERALPMPAGQLKVGLAWAGNPGHHQDAARSLRLAELAPILRTPKASFYSLQQVVPARDEACLRSVAGVLHSGAAFTDFLDTAAVIAQLDLVISVDTAVAHLAGALHKPVWLLLQHAPDWRWLLERTDTPWYPAMELYRQSERGRWDAPVQQAAATLRELAAARAPHRRDRLTPGSPETRPGGACRTTSPESKNSPAGGRPINFRRGRNIS